MTIRGLTLFCQGTKAWDGSGGGISRVVVTVDLVGSEKSIQTTNFFFEGESLVWRIRGSRHRENHPLGPPDPQKPLYWTSWGLLRPQEGSQEVCTYISSALTPRFLPTLDLPPVEPTLLSFSTFTCRQRSQKSKKSEMVLSQIEGPGPSRVLPSESSCRVTMNGESFSPYSPIIVPIVKKWYNTRN